ncbi:glycoside hydrolase family 88 protein [Tannerella sp.]|uniref:glycoside hydrolase family 88 protein n=1 Tax=Tannerella sp. TaxID=2382127 RepID=UPI0026DD0CC6|nr:glycoside hydrolase family 88 protein [Tannerella sp.]MDO4702496.1 glycoside hydrolase family 88 protein [Tannerella sp.]
MKRNSFLISALCLLGLFGCSPKETSRNTDTCPEEDPLSSVVQTAVQQIGFQVRLIEESGRILNPRTVHNGKVQYIPKDDWTSGFFPGTLFYLYDLTGNEEWKEAGIKYTEDLDSVKYLTWHHDVGFMINCSFGNALRVTGNDAYKEVLVKAAQSLATRFRPAAGVIQSWDEDRGWQGRRGWMCPVIIDNMMNLELLFKATELSGDSTYHNIAVSHADVTMNNHFRADGSCYHVVDYDKKQGGVRGKYTAQGYADESSWARGQAWAIYGYAICYRYTKDPRYLDMADRIYRFIFQHKNLPEDYIPYWDYDAPRIPNEPRDASAAAITASALYELASFGKTEYRETADKIIRSLSSDSYQAIVGTNGNFLLMHSVGSIPHDNEIDVPLNYADYYFLEALTRKTKMN